MEKSFHNNRGKVLKTKSPKYLWFKAVSGARQASPHLPSQFVVGWGKRQPTRQGETNNQPTNQLVSESPKPLELQVEKPAALSQRI